MRREVPTLAKERGLNAVAEPPSPVPPRLSPRLHHARSGNARLFCHNFKLGHHPPPIGLGIQLSTRALANGVRGVTLTASFRGAKTLGLCGLRKVARWGELAT